MATTVQHEKAKSFDWEPTYFHREARFPTKYKVPPRTKDPFKTLVREYVAMQEEKDSRQYGALEDALSRMNNAAQAEPRFMEALKPVLSFLGLAEYGAMTCASMLVDTVSNPELRQGYLVQMIDEVRHINQEAYLSRYYARHAPDPAGFNCGMSMRGLNPFGLAARSCFEEFMNNDPITNALNLQIVGETAYTNPLFVAVTEAAAANGDQTTPSVFLSIQSDEARHIANGYSTLAAVLTEPDNLPMVQLDFDMAFWRQHAFLDPFEGVVYDYFTKVRLKSYEEYWDEWIWEDWAGSYVERLEPFGLKVPDGVVHARRHIQWGGHSAAMFAAALWPVHAWRTDCMVEQDFEWFEEKYPGWDEHYGAFWSGYREMADPRNGHLALELLPHLPPACRVCQMPTFMPRPDVSEATFAIDSAGRRHAFCSEGCRFIYLQDPARHQGSTWCELNDGIELADYIERAGLLRADGKTLVAQPHLDVDESRLWTIDDIRRTGAAITNPLKSMPKDQFTAI